MNDLRISENIIRLRRKKGVTQEELAGFIGVTKASVSKWETAQSMPDILLLPQLAAFFDVTVDELLGYEPQMSREQIKACYHRLASEFAEKPFEEVMEESERLVKQYYSCYPFLLQICVLWMNHFMLAPDADRQQEILAGIVGLCEHILRGCKDLGVCNNAASIKVVTELQRGKAEEVIGFLEGIQTRNYYGENSELLVQAYLAAGKPEPADLAAQIEMYRHVMGILNMGIQLLIVHGQDKKRCEEIIGRLDALIHAFYLERLNSNAVAGYEYQAAVTMCGQGMEEAAYGHLEKYVEAVGILFQGEIELHGDSFFDRLEEWFEELDLGRMAVRDRKLIASSAMAVLSQPVFATLSDAGRMERIRERMRRLIEEQPNNKEGV